MHRIPMKSQQENFLSEVADIFTRITIEIHIENGLIAEMFTAESYCSSGLSNRQTSLHNNLLNLNLNLNLKKK